MSRYGSRPGIKHDCSPLEPGRDLREQLKPLASQGGFPAGEAGDVPTGAVEPRDDAAGDGVDPDRKDDRDCPRLPLYGSGRRAPACQDDVGLQADQLLRDRSYPIGVTASITKVHPHVAAIGPTQAREGLRERREHSLRHGIVFVERHEHADAPHAVALLRARRERACRRATEERDELAAIHSMTSSAMARSCGGTSMPSSVAVPRLMTSSNFTACWTGSSVGLAPLRMLPV